MHMPETLEQRRLFDVTAAVTAGVLNVYGDANDNTIKVYKSGSDLIVKGYITSPWVPAGSLLQVAEGSVSQIRIWGYGGDDTISIASNVVQPLTAQGGVGADSIQAGGGPSVLWGHMAASGGFWIPDDNAADLLIGGAGNDELYGQGGADTLQTSPDAAIASCGIDGLFGGSGDDVLKLNGALGLAGLYGGAGNDTFRPDPGAAAHYGAIVGDGGRDVVDYNGWQAAIFAQPDGVHYSGLRNGLRRHQLSADLEVIIGSSYNDWMVDGPANNQFFGRDGNDFLSPMRENGSADQNALGNDTYYGGNGADSLYGGQGDDRLCGESGDDWISGDMGDDTLVGGTGADTMYGMTGSDVIDARDGIAGNDWLVGAWKSGSDIMSDPGAHDVCYIDLDQTVAGDLLLVTKDMHDQFEEIHWI
jgi:Ca2+-binding RTX toxin-like protein